MNWQSLGWMSLVIALLCLHLPEPSSVRKQLIHVNGEERNDG